VKRIISLDTELLTHSAPWRSVMLYIHFTYFRSALVVSSAHWSLLTASVD